MDATVLAEVAEDNQRNQPIDRPHPEPEASSSSATAPLKRSASQAFEDVPESNSTSRKRVREENEEVEADDENGGTSCPACRTVSTSVSFSRPLQTVVDTLLRHAPGKARSASERMQADAIYHPGVHLRIPSPRQVSPEPNVPAASSIYVRPCPHCLPGNQWGWRCPQPIADPDTDPAHAWLLEEGNPPGHGVCGNWYGVFHYNRAAFSDQHPPARTFWHYKRRRPQDVISAKCRSAASAFPRDASPRRSPSNIRTVSPT
ncbi:hypothetical protein NUW54_g9267 [Trametes sanguinea]|uniref:Uncharacterized protein n=1 Tax=Trametes sanguinea TaxID=158606 RepID=A0ACC1P8J2_9APHY|nr:hypothetical protein NUW54_g9267 [Trametes sanguinea]